MGGKVVVKLGGSLFSTSDEKLIDFEFLSEFKKLVLDITKDGTQVAVVVGGGFVTRKYQQLLKDNHSGFDNNDLDWIGIATINLNAVMVRSFFHDIAEEEIIRYKEFDRIDKLEFSKPLIVCAAKEPGHSSDTDAVYIAEKTGSKNIYRLTNVDAIYTEDPKKNPYAEKLARLTWDEYFEIVGEEFVPGAHYPIDPVASRKAKQFGISFHLMDGRNFDNARKAFAGEEFDGTTVSNSV